MVRDKLADLGIRLRWWQVAIARIILSKNAAGKYTTTIGGVGLSIPRQVGKTFLVGAIAFALCLLRPGLTVIWSAHRTRTAEETFKKMQAFARRKAIKPFILKVVLGSGEESIEFVNGSRIMFGARAEGFGRGFDEVDVVVYDEAQILAQSALDDMVPAMNQCRQPEGALMFFMGTPPQKKDVQAGKAEVFTLMRESAKQGDEDTAWIEFGADDGYVPTPLPNQLTDADWEQIKKANPSYPDDTPVEAILRMRKKLGDASFLLEGAGVWDELVAQLAVVPAAIWAERIAAELPTNDQPPVALALDRWHDGTTAIAGSWDWNDETYVELLALDVARDTAGVVDWLAERAGQKIPVFIAADSPAASLAADLIARKVKVVLLAGPDFARSCQSFATDAIEGGVTHSDQEQLNAALAGATTLAFGKAGAWVWDRRTADNDISPLVAVTLARHGATVASKSKPSVVFAF